MTINNTLCWCVQYVFEFPTPDISGNFILAIRVATQWYQSHLGAAARVLLITNDRENKRKATEEGISAETGTPQLLFHLLPNSGTTVLVRFNSCSSLHYCCCYHYYCYCYGYQYYYCIKLVELLYMLGLSIKPFFCFS